MQENNTEMDRCLCRLATQRIHIRFFAGECVRMQHWIGAVLRNRFLYAAEEVKDEQGISLRQLIDTLPLPEGHFLYGQLQGGFPKGFLFDCSQLPCRTPGFALEANRVYTFSLILTGKWIDSKALFMMAIKRMMEGGFGHPVVPMTLVDMREEEVCHATPSTGHESIDLELQFNTPVCLIHQPKGSGNGFQNKLNNFPSFYQLVRSLAYRVVTLSMLYNNGEGPDSREQMEEWIEQYTEAAVQAVLLRAELHYEKCRSTPRKGKDSIYSMEGYTGRLAFGNVPARFLPLLALGTTLGAGAHINYGLGQFRVRPYLATGRKRDE